MEIFKFLEQNFILFFLIFYRILLLFFLFPIFNSVLLPNKLKILISLVFALVLAPVIHFKLPQIRHIYELVFILFSDFILIFLIALLFRIILAGIQVGGELVGYQMGFGITQTIDPLSGFSLPIISQFVYIVFLMLFFSFNFHYYLIYFIYQSFEKIPPGNFILTNNLGLYLIKKSRLIFELGIKFLAPLMVFMMLIYISLAIIGRLIPQMNVMFVSFPLTIGLGLIFFGFMLILLPKMIGFYFSDYFRSLYTILRLH